MPRAKDYASVLPGAVVSLHRQPIARFSFPQQVGRASTEFVCDFSTFGFRSDVALALAEAYQWRHCKSGFRSISSDWQTFRKKLVPWLASTGYINKPLEEVVSNRIRDQYLRHVFDHPGWNARTAAKTFSRMNSHFIEVAKRHSTLAYTQRGFITRNAHVRDSMRDPEIIPNRVFQEIRRALMTEIRSAWSHFEQGQAALSRARRMELEGRPPPLGPSLESILYHVHTRYDGLVPPRARMSAGFRTAVSRYFNEVRARALVDRFHAALDRADVAARNHGRMEAVRERYGISIAAYKRVGTGQSGRVFALPILRRVAADTHVSLEWLLTGRGSAQTKDSDEFLQWAKVAKQVRTNGSSEDIHQYLYATSDAICAYIAFLATETGANSDTMFCWPRDVLRENVFMKNVFTLDRSKRIREKLGRLEWDKGRSVVKQRAVFADVGSWGPVNLIRQVLATTAPLLAHVAVEKRDLLFLAYKGNPGKADSDEVAGHIIQETFRRSMRRFAAKYDIPFRHLNHRTIRATVISAEFLRTNRQLKAAQTVAGHASPSTTDHYLENILVRRESDLLVGNLQNRLVGAIRAGDLSVMVDPQRADSMSASPDEALAGRAVATDESVTLAGGVCRNVRGGYVSGTKEGEICIQWWSCFGCAGAVFVPIPKFVARWIQAIEHLQAQRTNVHPLKWRELYEPKLLLAQERVLSVSPDVVAQARTIVPTLPPLPDII